MPKELFNEAERFLLGRWGEARLLEESMDGVRTKYKELFQRIIDAVTEGQSELDVSAVFVTQFWGEGYVGFGRKSWPGSESNWPSGFWLNNLRLEVLTADDSEAPNAYIEFSNKSKSNLDLDAARLAMNTTAKEVLTPEELKGVTSADTGRLLLWLPAPPKAKLLSALASGDGEEFVELFVSQFDMMARFVPSLDKVFRDCVLKD